MPYADTDFFIALSDVNDRLNPAAITLYAKYKEKINTSLAVLIELALVARKKGKPVGPLIESVIRIAHLTDANPVEVLRAAYLIDISGVGVFDAFHAALCDGEIVSSDHVYDRIGIKRIKM
jgi:hypothetical protein